MKDPTTSSAADGVLVASVWRGEGGDVLVRLTMTQPGDPAGDTVRTASSTAEALAYVEEWLSSIG